MTDILRTIAADALEAPEEATKMIGQALQAIGSELEKLSARIQKLEEMVAGSSQAQQ
jgi:hypothetical protein